jgi:CRP/FNR family cyclic AMP-dependent transcriptional regulator
MEDSTFLARVPLFASLKPDHLAELAGKLRVRSYRRGEVIFHQDDPGVDLHIIKSGQVKIAASSPEGEEIIMALLTAGDSFGEIALLDGEPRSAGAIAMEATQTLTLNRSDFLDVVTGNAEMVRAILATVAAGWRKASHLLQDAMFLDLPARLAKRLLELAEKHGIKTADGVEIDLLLTQQDLAAAVGVSRVAMNKQLGLFQDRGLISLEKKRIVILRPDELKKRIY